ncbi:MAG: hypothetical protein GX638_05380, partial [Crenarchaeota archaeon]|nr:hypothetical protein [Thermoproteota archaeon]
MKPQITKWRVGLLCFVMVYVGFLLIELGYKSILWDESVHFIGGLLLSRGDIWQWIWTNSFYPPVFDSITAFYFLINGSASVFAARLVAVTFAALSAFVIYFIAEKMYGPKTAIISAIFFGVMPGIVWASRMAMIETLLIFVFSLLILFFYKWLGSDREKDRIIFTAIIVIGVAIKYQMLVLAPIIVIAGMIFWKREFLKKEAISYFIAPRLKFTIILISIAAIVSAAILLSGILDIWFFAIQTGTQDKAAYSIRYPQPIYYFFEMTWISSEIHPISPLLYGVGLAGLGLFAFRQKKEDKLLLLWFIVVYLVFTIIPNREWRYVTTLFPVLAISAANALTTGACELQKIWQIVKNSSTRKVLAKIGAVFLIALTIGGVALSCVDSYNWISSDHTNIPTDQAVNYLEPKLCENQTVMVACPLNQFNSYMVWFYLNQKTPHPSNNVTQYPKLAVDAYTPDFNISECIYICEQNNTKFVLLYEHAEATTYFETTFNMQQA